MQPESRVVYILNYIWLGMLVVGFVTSILNGRLEEVTKAFFESAGKAVELSIGLLGIMCLWSGLVNISQKSGMTKAVAFLARPLLKRLFPQIADNNKAMGAIAMNLAANSLGLGNAATPLGIKAMIELQRINGKSTIASDAMCMFLVLNTSAIQLIPTMIIALRYEAGSKAPAEITACIWGASICATIVGIATARFLSKAGRSGKRLKAKLVRK